MAQQSGDVEFCPRCGMPLTDGAGFVQEFWIANETVHYCWCAGCSWRGEIKSVTRMIGIEPAENEAAGSDPDALQQLRELESLYKRS